MLQKYFQFEKFDDFITFYKYSIWVFISKRKNTKGFQLIVIFYLSFMTKSLDKFVQAFTWYIYIFYLLDFVDLIHQPFFHFMIRGNFHTLKTVVLFINCFPIAILEFFDPRELSHSLDNCFVYQLLSYLFLLTICKFGGTSLIGLQPFC